MSKRIITINRMYGSGGRVLGKALAEKLGYAFYDKELIELAGKGHEDYQEIEGVNHPMDERVLIAEILTEQ